MQTSRDKACLVFIDFKDSFSFNILSYLKSWGEVKVISPSEVSHFLSQEHMRFIWGPGPGLATDYDLDFELIRKSLNCLNHKHFGICLGHQILALCLGGVYRKLQSPLHGMNLSIQLPEWNNWGIRKAEVNVQFYNSLVVDINESDSLHVFKHQGDCLMLSTKRMISCQFHPESVGTSCPDLFFSAIKRNFL